jgi:ferredoxin-thioredoxin reductase catalytic subunit
MSSVCDRLTFHRRRFPVFGTVEYTATAGGIVPVAKATVRSTLPFKGKPIVAVADIRVDSDIQRCGVGTKLYELLQQEACKERAHLASDVYRTRFSEGFWKKQRRRGRAYCPRDERRGVKLDDQGKRVGTWPCYRYVMREVCPERGSLGRGSSS